ncbi:metallophosphoesterase family protein [Ancylobacter sp. FA202]|uniref:metallophosphoesterase family protein n=1 Tax=Ancylobacter sp. FA202 TaxID=1111106 RepID=UPI00037D5353|nr:metallophosphoesterase family protein [Ancylobacter sp. FA202]
MFFSRFRAAGTRRAPARIPEGVRVYAIGDIHGRHDLLLALLAAIAADTATSTNACRLVFLGDYIDRGDGSAGVIARLLSGVAEGDADGRTDASWTCLMGNHEATLLAALAGEADWETWLRMGGAETLFSYGLSARSFAGPGRDEQLREAALAAIPAAHLDFLRQLPASTEIGDYYFCHAGIRPGVPLDQQSRDDLIWIRDPFIRSARDHGKRIVHGHTPVMEVELHANRINVDTGAYLTHRLSCVVLEGDQARVIHT